MRAMSAFALKVRTLTLLQVTLISLATQEILLRSCFCSLSSGSGGNATFARSDVGKVSGTSGGELSSMSALCFAGIGSLVSGTSAARDAILVLITLRDEKDGKRVSKTSRSATPLHGVGTSRAKHYALIIIANSCSLFGLPHTAFHALSSP